MRRQTLALCALLAAVTAADALFAASRSPLPAETAVSDVPIGESAPATATNLPPRFIFDAPITEQPRAAGEIPAEPPVAVRPQEPPEEEADAPAAKAASESAEPAPATDEPAPRETAPESSSAASAAQPAAADTALQRLAAVEAALAQQVDLLARELLQQSGGDAAGLAALARDSAARFDAIESAADREAEVVFASLGGAAAEEARAAYAAAKTAQLGYWRALIAGDVKKDDKNADDFQISP